MFRSFRPIPVLGAIFLLGCAGPEAPTTTVDRSAERIVTINGTLTEIVCALGRTAQIVGVDVTSTYPPEVQQLPKVGHDRQVGAEGVISLAPDLVLGVEGQLASNVRGQVERAGHKVALFTHELSVEGTKTLIRQVADTLGAGGAADELLRTMDKDLEAVQPLPTTPKVLFIYARGAGALMVAGDGTPMQRMIELAGGRNAVEGFSQFKPLTPEALIAADPDAVLLFDSGLDALQGPEGLLAVPGMAATKAGRNKAFIVMDGGLLSNFGPRLGLAIAQLNAAFHALP